MSVTLIATVGGTDSNAYIDADDAQLIVDATPNADASWGTDTDKQEQALVYATSILDVMAYKGQKTLITNALQWPRAAVLDPDYSDHESHIPGAMLGAYGVYLDMYTIPKRIKRACVMLALEVLKAGTNDVWGVDSTFGVKVKTVDVLTTEYFEPYMRKTGLRVYPSVWREIQPLLRASGSSSVERA